MWKKWDANGTARVTEGTRCFGARLLRRNDVKLGYIDYKTGGVFVPEDEIFVDTTCNAMLSMIHRRSDAAMHLDMFPSDLEPFHGGANEPKHARLYVTISKQSIIWLNVNCYRMLGEPKGVRLHFSRKSGTIALEPVNQAPWDNTFPVRSTRRTGYRICALPFCRHFGIKVSETLRFSEPQLSEDGRMLLLNLRSTSVVTVKQAPRMKRSELSRPPW